MKKVEIFIELLNEGTPTVRSTEAELLGDNIYRVLPTPNYDPEDEELVFVPGTVVKCVSLYDEEEKEEYLQAVEAIDK